MADALEYFEPESRLQQREKLKHLVRFSDFVLIISGEAGSGKTALLQQLAPDPHQGSEVVAHLELDDSTDVTGVLTRLVSELDLQVQDDNRLRLSGLHMKARQLADDAVPLLILIDDADYLTNNALELLINFVTAEQGAAPRLLMTGSPEFVKRFDEMGLAQSLDSHLHIERLDAFTPAESAEYLESLFPQELELGTRQLRAMVEKAEGRPGRLRALAAEYLRKDGGRSVKMPKVLPPIHITASALILLGVFSAAIWQYLPEDEEAPTVTERVSLPLPVIAAANTQEPVRTLELAETEQVVEEASTYTPDSSSEASPAMEPAPLPDPEPVILEETAQVEVVPEPEPEVVPKPEAKAETKPEPKPQPVAAPKTEPKPEPKPAPAPKPAPEPKIEPKPAPKPAPTPEPVAQVASGVAKAYLREDELMSWPDRGYTLQMLGAREEKSVKAFLDAQAQPERFYYFNTIFKGKPWHVVVYGQYADRNSALNAVSALPSELQKLRPWARSIAGVKADINKENQ